MKPPSLALLSRSVLMAVGVAGLAIYGAWLYRHACFAVGGSDSSGYANAARALVDGPLVAPIPGLERFGLPASEAPLFVPLGYVRVGDSSMAPLYPVGFPLHVAAAARIAGWELGPYLVSPIAALLSVFLVFLVGRELGLTGWWAAGAGLLLAASPVLVFQGIQPMSDVVATAWCLAAIYAALRSRSDARWAAAAGLAFGIAVLVRPLDALVAIPLLFALPMKRRALTLFALGGLPCAVALFAYNFACFGNPFQSGYGLYGLGHLFSWANLPARLPRYALWTAQVLTPLVGLGWVASLWDRRIPRRDRALLFTWFGSVVLAYSAYQPADDWWFTRFLLPALPALPLGFMLVVRDLRRAVASRSVAWGRVVGAVAILAAAFVAGSGFRSTAKLNVLELHRLQRAFPDGCRRAAQEFPAGALVLSGEMSGALRYYTDLTPVRWENLDAGRFAALRARTEAAGGRWFAAVMKHEVPMAAPRVPGSWTFLGESGPVTLWRLESGPP